jgi:hypothetical protein
MSMNLPTPTSPGIQSTIPDHASRQPVSNIRNQDSETPRSPPKTTEIQADSPRDTSTPAIATVHVDTLNENVQSVIPEVPEIQIPEIQIELAKDIVQLNTTEIEAPAGVPIPIHGGTTCVVSPSSEDKDGGFRLSVGRARGDSDLEQLLDVEAMAPFGSEVCWVKRDGLTNEDFVKSNERDPGDVWVCRVFPIY